MISLRKHVVLKDSLNIVKKIMLYEFIEGDYLFACDTEGDVPGIAEYYYGKLQEAEEMWLHKYNIKHFDWIEIYYSKEYCQHDIIVLVKVKGQHWKTQIESL